jgi:hypothetical protein
MTLAYALRCLLSDTVPTEMKLLLFVRRFDRSYETRFPRSEALTVRNSLAKEDDGSNG